MDIIKNITNDEFRTLIIAIQNIENNDVKKYIYSRILDESIADFVVNSTLEQKKLFLKI